MKIFILILTITFGSSVLALATPTPFPADSGIQLPNRTTLKGLNVNIGYEIKIQLKPFQNQMAYLGHYFGNEYPVIDSTMLDAQGEGVFKKDVKLPEGIYIIFYPDKAGYLDVLVDENQYFSVNIDLSGQGSMNLNFANSPANVALNQYQHFMSEQGQQIEGARQQLENATNAQDSATWIGELGRIDKSIQDYRAEIIHGNPKSMLSVLLMAMREPRVPEALMNPNNPTDSAEAKRFVKDHYWDGVNFWEGWLTYTPFFDSKLNKYFDEVLEKKTDSVIQKIDWMMGYARANNRMNEFMMNKLLNSAADHRYKWDDAVFIHLFEKYVASQEYPWFSADERKKVTEKAYFMMGNMVGTPASDIELPGMNGKKQSMSGLNAEYTLVCFWDPTCSHCRATLPRLDSIYQAKWKAAGLKVFAVANEMDGTKEDWQSFVAAFNLGEWANVYNSQAEIKERALSGQLSYLQTYDVWYYPTFFLLDKQKRFIAKKLQYEPMFDLVESLLKRRGTVSKN